MNKNFVVNLQLFGGGGGKSGLGGGSGESGSKNKNGEQLGYLFYFTGVRNGKELGQYKWVPGNTPSEALKNAIDIGKKSNTNPSNPMGQPDTRENINRKIDEARERQKKKSKK